MGFLKHLHPIWKRDTSTYDNAHSALLSSLNAQMTDLEERSLESKLEMYLQTSSGEWLDLWGNWFGVTREDDETDDAYRERMIQHILMLRGTIPAIQSAIKRFLDDDEIHIEIYEPYKDIFFLNRPESKLNGRKHLQGRYYTYAVIDIKMSRPFPDGLIDLINNYKPLGVKFILSMDYGKYDPNAPISDFGYTVDRSFTEINKDMGYRDYIRGHINITDINPDSTEKTLFYLNKSGLNSGDVLSGDYNQLRSNYHLVSVSDNSISIDQNTTMTMISSNSTEANSAFYNYPRYNDDRYATLEVPENTEQYLYFTLNARQHLALNYFKYLDEQDNNGNISKPEWLYILDSPYIQYKMKADVSPTNPMTVSVQIYHLATRSWVELSTYDVKNQSISTVENLGAMTDYINDQGLVFTRMRINTNGQTEPRDFRLGFFELGFTKTVAKRPRVHGGIVSTRALTDIFSMRKSLWDPSGTWDTYSDAEGTVTATVIQEDGDDVLQVDFSETEGTDADGNTVYGHTEFYPEIPDDITSLPSFIYRESLDNETGEMTIYLTDGDGWYWITRLPMETEYTDLNLNDLTFELDGYQDNTGTAPTEIAFPLANMFISGASGTSHLFLKEIYLPSMKVN